MEDHRRQQPQSSSSSSSIPLVSRLDHIDFIMKHLEGKKRDSNSSARAAGGAQPQHKSLDSAVREAYFKGSLFDRVASLEHRLFQLCLEMESSSSSSGAGTTSSQTFEEMCSSHRAIKAEFSRLSLPTFTNNPIINQESLINLPNQVNNRGDQYQLRISKSDENSEDMTRKGKKNPDFLKQKLKKKKKKKSIPNTDEMTSKSAGHNKSSSFWPHLKLLGC